MSFIVERALRDGLDIVVGTPGRIQDLIDRGSLSLDSIRCVGSHDRRFHLKKGTKTPFKYCCIHTCVQRAAL